MLFDILGLSLMLTLFIGSIHLSVHNFGLIYEKEGDILNALLIVVGTASMVFFGVLAYKFLVLIVNGAL